MLENNGRAIITKIVVERFTMYDSGQRRIYWRKSWCPYIHPQMDTAGFFGIASKVGAPAVYDPVLIVAPNPDVLLLVQQSAEHVLRKLVRIRQVKGRQIRIGRRKIKF